MDVKLPPELLEAVGRAGAAVSACVSLHLVRGDPARSLGARLEDVVRGVVVASGGLVPVTVDEDAGRGGSPSLSIRVGTRDVVRFFAVPAGVEEGALVAGLAACAGASRSHSNEPGPALRADLTVFISATCANCPIAVRSAIALAAVSPQLTVSVVDIAEYPEWAAEAGVRSVPTIVTADGLTIVGVLGVGELADRITGASGPGGDRLLLGSQLEAGRFAAAGELLAAERAHPEFVARWQASGMEGRIGLVLAADEALHRSRRALDSIVPQLLEGLRTGPNTSRGDTADLLGRIGHPAARSALEALTRDPDEDVAEAAADALAAIDAREASPEGGATPH